MFNPFVASRFLWIAIAGVALCLLASCYAPGLKGNFQFDDFANLPALGAMGPVDSGPAFLRYITSGKADPTGRPIALLSFLIDSRDWPAAAFPFKRTNLILHLINGALLGCLLDMLGVAAGLARDKARWAALVGSFFWAIHPFFVSTVLYVVQREAMLCGTFVLLALLCWSRARSSYRSSAAAGIAWATLGTCTCLVLATFSKANGLLVPVLVLVLQATLPHGGDDTSRRFNRFTLIIFGPLAALLGGYLLWTAVASVGKGPIPIRGWSVGQRLLTEPTILLDYVAQLWLLKPIDSTLLHDGYPVAHGLFDPWYTGAAIALCAAAVLAAWMGRKRMPLAAAAVLFFGAGHLMESTSLALELYFDHRNYIPAMLMFWPVAAVLANWRARAAANIVLVATVAVFAGLTYANTSLWGKPVEQATAWARSHPESARAQAFATDVQASYGLVPQALLTIDRASERFTTEPQIAFNLIDLHCATHRLTSADIAYSVRALRTVQREPGPLLSRWIEKIVTTVRDGRCAGLERSDLTAFLDAALANPRIAAVRGRRQDIAHLRGTIALAYGESEVAAMWFGRALAENPTPQAALAQAADLGRAGYPSLGLRHLEYFEKLPLETPPQWREGMPWLHAAVLAHQGYWEGELAHLRASLSASIKESGS